MPSHPPIVPAPEPTRKGLIWRIDTVALYVAVVSLALAVISKLPFWLLKQPGTRVPTIAMLLALLVAMVCGNIFRAAKNRPAQTFWAIVRWGGFLICTGLAVWVIVEAGFRLAGVF